MKGKDWWTDGGSKFAKLDERKREKRDCEAGEAGCDEVRERNSIARAELNRAVFHTNS